MTDIEIPERGTCVVCACTDENPCVLEGETCCWTDDSKTMCNFCEADTIRDDDIDDYLDELGGGDPDDIGPWDVDEIADLDLGEDL